LFVGQLPTLNAVELFTRHEHVKNCVKLYANKFLDSLGTGRVLWDETELDDLLCIFRDECLPYYEDINVGSPSHLKWLGFLLFCLTQQVADGDRRSAVYLDDFKFHEEIAGQLRSPTEVETDFNNFGNELLMFAVVFLFLNEMQRIRSDKKRYDTSEPPMHFRYLRAMLDYLRPHTNEKLNYQKTPFDLYLILKSYDLFGVDCDYSGGR
jgi:hypothetical protein